ncbi:SDR family oxidoreductase [Pelagibius marinus]|uniref:SDR family oxidoreductase n=1 Tax=Pelagibius marinus TaxID=2762760 RepID=UPI001D0488A0|nr:SDR family oxidoreductase [Pelagibius marinus]
MPRAALVTGAARRIGAALARALAADGWAVALHYHMSEAPARALAAEIAAAGGRAVALEADLRDEAALARLVEAAGSELGPLGLLVNNASIFEFDDHESCDRESWDAHLDTNLRAPFVLTQHFARALPEGTRGLVVNLLDTRVWNLSPGYLSYTLSKAGLWTLTHTLAQALAPQIRVNAIGPGPTLPSKGQSAEDFAARRAGLPLGDSASLGEICAALRFLIAAPSVTGQMIGLDGGDHLSREQPAAGTTRPEGADDS